MEEKIKQLEERIKNVELDIVQIKDILDDMHNFDKSQQDINKSVLEVLKKLKLS